VELVMVVAPIFKRERGKLMAEGKGRALWPRLRERGKKALNSLSLAKNGT